MLSFALALTMSVHAAGDASPSAQARGAPTDSPAPAPARHELRIRVTVDGKVIAGTLVESATARDFVSLLPLTLTLKDYSRTEKISDLPRRLSTQGAPAGSDPSVGDIAYYAPWGNLAIYYEDFGYSRGLVVLGKLDAVDLLRGRDQVKMTIELAR